MTPELERELGTGGDLLTSALARAAALSRARARCAGVLAPSTVWRRPDAMVAFSMPVAPGASLAELRAQRALSLGECVTVGVGVAQTLAAMHAERLAHGDVSAANVLVAGRKVTLVDTMGALCEERGTPGLAAPERTEGATTAGDVYSLGMLLRSLADPEASPVIDAWTAPLVADGPGERPTAAHAAAALARCAQPRPIRAPDAPVAAVMRAGAVQRTVKRPQDRWWRVERASLKLLPLGALAVVGAVTGAALVPAVAATPHAMARVSGAPTAVSAPVTLPLSASALAGPAEAAEELARRRVAALAAGDGDALLALSAPGSGAAAADRDTASGLKAGALIFDGLELTEVTAEVRELTPGGAIVEVTSTLSGYGVGQERVPGGTATAVLQLRVTQGGWLVERVLPPP